MLIRTTIAALLLTAACFAQDNAPPEQPRFYKLDFAVKELSAGKVTNARSYVTIVRAEHSTQSIRTGDKVPVPAGPSGSGQFTYIDVGVNIDVTDVTQAGSDLRLHVGADVSSAEKDGTLPNPIIRQTRWSSTVILPMRKPTTLFSSDSAGSKTQTQFELTATPLP